MLKVKHIKAICSTETYNNGRLLCQPGKVRKVKVTHVDDGTISASGLVLGNFGYYHAVKISMSIAKRNIIEDYDCNCYEQSLQKAPCRHCVALAFALAVDGEVDLGCRLDPVELPEDEAPVRAAETLSAAAVQPKPVRKPAPAVEETPEESAQADNTEIPEAEIPAEDTPVMEIPEEAIPAEKTPEEEIPEEDTEEPESEPVLDGPHRGMEIYFGHHLDMGPKLEDYEDVMPEEEKPVVPLIWNPNDTTKVFHTNTGIIGTMGTGKTQFTKSLITQLYRQQGNNYNGKPLGILIFDYKGDYNASKQDFVQAVNAKVIRPYKIPYNPLAIMETRMFKPLLPVHTANTFKDTISKVYRLGPKQQTALYSCIMDAYKAMGIDPAAPDTWKNRAPTFDMVYEIYEQNDLIPKNDSLAAAMQKLQQFQIFENNPYRTESLYDLLKGVVVIDLSGYDPDIQSLIVAITLDQFYSQMHATGSSPTDGTLRQLTKMILVDEADNFMREEFPALKKILKEGREFGVGTILSTQLLEHFTGGEDDYSKYILTWVVHNVADLKKSDVEYVFKTKLSSTETTEIYERIKRCDRFQSVVKIGNDPVHYIRDKAFFEL